VYAYGPRGTGNALTGGDFTARAGFAATASESTGATGDECAAGIAALVATGDSAASAAAFEACGLRAGGAVPFIGGEGVSASNLHKAAASLPPVVSAASGVSETSTRWLRSDVCGVSGANATSTVFTSPATSHDAVAVMEPLTAMVGEATGASSSAGATSCGSSSTCDASASVLPLGSGAKTSFDAAATVPAGSAAAASLMLDGSAALGTEAFPEKAFSGRVSPLLGGRISSPRRSLPGVPTLTPDAERDSGSAGGRGVEMGEMSRGASATGLEADWGVATRTGPRTGFLSGVAVARLTSAAFLSLDLLSAVLLASAAGALAGLPSAAFVSVGVLPSNVAATALPPATAVALAVLAAAGLLPEGAFVGALVISEGARGALMARPWRMGETCAAGCSGWLVMVPLVAAECVWNVPRSGIRCGVYGIGTAMFCGRDTCCGWRHAVCMLN
jgi:hypothetical protein